MYEMAEQSPTIFFPAPPAPHIRPLAADGEQGFVFGAASRMITTLLFVTVATPLVMQQPDWLKATLVGCICGVLVLAGLSCSWTTHRATSGAYALIQALVAQASMRVLTDFEHNSCWTLVCLLIMSGWVMGLVLTPWHRERRRPTRLGARSNLTRQAVRCTIWDIVCLTTIVAGLCWYAPRVDSPLDLFCQCAPTLVGGILVSGVAVQWAWRDLWSITRLSWLLLAMLLSVGLCLLYAPMGRDPGEIAAWFIAGPASVMAAQGLTVLVALSAARVDTQCRALESVFPTRTELSSSCAQR